MCRPLVSPPFDMRELTYTEHIIYDRLMSVTNPYGHDQINTVFVELVRLRGEERKLKTLREYCEEAEADLNRDAEQWKDWRDLVVMLQGQVAELLRRFDGGKVHD